ncbi:GINS complex, Psf3 component [Gonapodya prolifera JEL478]|uniref:DNA replication complex GINS protein PSF3 n=1 Tax=Gonapodya prolifera (strain JEL478) TaxID=1344416 RepID=A0A139A842_GONPJ|nr:GINS complex, Psf3 component [Gonapodya prolifera JEL478]|eukprot:KXS12615.1 GINS complex, Psf3 component [Gonapodya prolifera JEL478]
MDVDLSAEDGRGEEYWDIDAILAEQQKVACYVKSDVPHFGYLAGSKSHMVGGARYGDAVTPLANPETENISQQLPKGSRVEVPFWLASQLALNQLVDIEVPRCFGTRARNDLKASPTAVDLNLLCPYFYAFGCSIFNLVIDRTLNKVLATTFTQRMQRVMDYTQSSILGGAAMAASAEQDRFLRTLEEEEKELHRLGVHSALDTRRFYSNEPVSTLRKSDALGTGSWAG